MVDEIIFADRNNKESFLVNIHFQRNSTWQGTLTWIDKKKTLRFRSMLEMVKLMDNAISSPEDENIENWE